MVSRHVNATQAQDYNQHVALRIYANPVYYDLCINHQPSQ